MRALVALVLAGCAGAIEPATYTRTERAESSEGGWSLAVARCDAGDELIAAECDHPRVRFSEPAQDVEGFGPGWSCGGYRPISVIVTCERR